LLSDDKREMLVAMELVCIGCYITSWLQVVCLVFSCLCRWVLYRDGWYMHRRDKTQQMHATRNSLFETLVMLIIVWL